MNQLIGRVAVLVSPIAQDDTGALIATALESAGAEVAVVGSAACSQRAAKNYTCDLLDSTALQETLRRVQRDLGRIDILVDLPPGSIGSQRLGHYQPEDWQQTLQQNLFKSFLVFRACLPIMGGQGGGCIIALASMSARRVAPLDSAFGASMAGLVQLVRSVAVEYGQEGIRANAILAGEVQGEALEEDFGNIGALLGMSASELAGISKEAAPLKRLARPQDIANLVVFLASDAASYLTGLAIPLAGGKEL